MVRKSTAGNLNTDSHLGDLLRLTEKVGVASTRHKEGDYLSKLQNGYKSKDQIFVYKPPQAQVPMTAADLNSPKY